MFKKMKFHNPSDPT